MKNWRQFGVSWRRGKFFHDYSIEISILNFFIAKSLLETVSNHCVIVFISTLTLWYAVVLEQSFSISILEKRKKTVKVRANFSKLTKMDELSEAAMALPVESPVSSWQTVSVRNVEKTAGTRYSNKGKKLLTYSSKSHLHPCTDVRFHVEKVEFCCWKNQKDVQKLKQKPKRKFFEKKTIISPCFSSYIPYLLFFYCAFVWIRHLYSLD